MANCIKCDHTLEYGVCSVDTCKCICMEFEMERNTTHDVEK